MHEIFISWDNLSVLFLIMYITTQLHWSDMIDCVLGKHSRAAGWAIWTFQYVGTDFVARGGAVGWDTALQAGRSRGWFPTVSLYFFHWHNPSDRTVALGSTQPLTEMSTSNISCG